MAARLQGALCGCRNPSTVRVYCVYVESYQLKPEGKL